MKGPYNDIEYFHPEILAFIRVFVGLWGTEIQKIKAKHQHSDNI